MKKIYISLLLILFAAGVKAQIGMPKELTCTEEAFNFSFSLGTKWKFSTPKMGPVDVITNAPGYMPAGYLKISNVAFETYSQPLSETAFNAGNSGYSVNQPGYIPLSYSASLKMTDTPNYLFPEINFSSPVNCTLLKPDLLLNSNLSTGRIFNFNL